MPDGDLVDRLAEALAGLTPDVLEPILGSLDQLWWELGTLDHDDVVRLVCAAIIGVAGAAARVYLESHRAEIETAVRRALAAT